MNLDDYISKNLDNILDNPDEFLGDKINNITKSNKKKVTFCNNLNNSDNLDNNELYEKEPNEDDYNNDIIGELYQNMYERKLNKNNNLEFDINNFEEINNYYDKTNNVNEPKFEFEFDDGYYFFNLINIFMKYYNKKYDKNETFFSNIKDNEKGTSYQMELFYDIIIEYKIIKEKEKLDNEKCMNMIYIDSNENSEKILELFSKSENQIYMLEIKENKYISSSLIVCLNYIYENNLIDSEWNIYNLRNI